MGKKMKLPLMFKNREQAKQPWQWPSCTNPSRTSSFRGGAGDHIFKTVNSVFFDPSDGIETPESWFTNSSASASFSTESEDCSAGNGADSLETIIRGLRSSERLFFEPGDTSSSILDDLKADYNDNQLRDEDEQHQNYHQQEEDGDGEEVLIPFKESVVLAMESEDPYGDFKRSMAEMVESHGLKDWEYLQELLGWYLKMNAKMNHGFIVGAFVDLLIELASDSAVAAVVNGGVSDSTSFSSAASSFSSPSSPLSPLGHKEIEEDLDGIE